MLAGLVVADAPQLWSSLGFLVDGTLTRVGGVTVELGGGGGPGLSAWVLHGPRPSARVAGGPDPTAPPLPGDIDGLETRWDPGRPPLPAGPGTAHPNGVVAVDHVVVVTPDLGRTIAALEGAGLALRRTRPIGGNPPRAQAFFRAGEVIVEVVGPLSPTGGAPARFWGIAFTCTDLDATCRLLGDRLRPARDAVQAGRRIATLERAVGAGVEMALMSTPDPAGRRQAR